VFANGREVSCKASDGKVVAAMPDVCLSPPSPPAGPVPIPYPLNSFASDTSDGSKTVKISGQEIMLKDKSYFKKCTGDEAATKTLGQGVVTHTITGKVYFVSWSPDVEVEGENAVRHLDMTTSNHACPLANQSAPWAEIAKMFKRGGKCAGMDDLKLSPYKDGCPPTRNGKPQTPHHLIPDRCTEGMPGYSHGNAPCICASRGNQHQGSHKRCHSVFDPTELNAFKKGKKIKYNQARDAAAKSAGGAMNPPRKLSKKEKGCIALQLDAYYKAKPPAGPGLKANDDLNTSGKPGKVIPSEMPKWGR
jgi:hypothetical protein